MIYRPRRIIVVACLSLVTFGIVLTTLGATLPNLIARFGIDKRQAGSLLSLLSLGVLAGSLVFGPLVDRRGYRGAMLLCFALIAAGLEAVAFSSSVGALRASVLLIGVTGGIVNGAANALAADVSADSRGGALAFVGAFFGVGAAGVPLLLAAFSARFTQTAMLAGIGAFALVPFALTALTAFPEPKQPHGLPIADARRLLRDRVLLLVGVMLFLESGIEGVVGGWVSTFFAEDLRVPLGRAPVFLALFWLGLLVTRLLLGFILTSVNLLVMRVSLAVSLSSILWLMVTRAVGPAAVAVFVLGCGFAPVFPLLLAFVAGRYAHISGTAFSLVFTMALTGGMIMPYVSGAIADAHGLRSSFALVPFSLLVMAGLLATLTAVSATSRAS